MQKRRFGKTNAMVTEVGLGTWQLGTRWGEPFNEEEAQKILEAAYEGGINFIDTADIYNGGRSELAIREVLRRHPGHFYVTTKIGRGMNPHVAEGYTPEVIRGFVEGSLKRLDVERLDMVLLHCPPTPVYQKDDVFAELDRLVRDGKLAAYGVSIEKVAEGLQALEYNISAMEVIFNMFRLKPTEELFPAAQAKDVGIIARVPLASGLLTGQVHPGDPVRRPGPPDLHRHGEAFDKGETFSA